MKQKIDLSELRALLPERATINFQRKKGQTQRWYLSIEVTITPSVPEKDYDILVQKIISLYGEDLIEVYTEETGHWFFVYLRMSSSVPTTVIP